MGSGGGFVGTEEELRQRVEEAKADVDVAVFLGAPMIRLFGGHVPEGVEDREPLWGPMIRCFQEVADYAATKGIIVGLQNHDNRNMAATGDDVLRILRETDRENFTFILDTGQWKGSIGAHPRGEFDPDVDIYRYMEQTAPYASYVRAKIYKIDSGREEWIDYKRVIKILKAVNFNGSLSIVFEGQGNRCEDAEAIRLAVKHLRELLALYGG
ncbi:MAG: TIM barrel protein [Candidatus Latescibacteria bacterium]|nr:TIM barrel protein [Candidatus Latescibacterota bacterium]